MATGMHCTYYGSGYLCASGATTEKIVSNCDYNSSGSGYRCESFIPARWSLTDRYSEDTTIIETEKNGVRTRCINGECKVMKVCGEIDYNCNEDWPSPPPPKKHLMPTPKPTSPARCTAAILAKYQCYVSSWRVAHLHLWSAIPSPSEILNPTGWCAVGRWQLFWQALYRNSGASYP